MYTVVSTSKIFDAFKQYKIGTVICAVLLKYVDYHTSKQVDVLLFYHLKTRHYTHARTHARTRTHKHTQIVIKLANLSGGTTQRFVACMGVLNVWCGSKKT